MNADGVFAKYSSAAPLDAALIDALVTAIESPLSPPLKRIIDTVRESADKEFYLSPAFRAMCDEGYADDEALFRSEVLERLVIHNMFSDRLTASSERANSLGRIREPLDWAAKIYRPREIAWDWPAI